jgi:osmotically-inducible protein OsmY
MPPLTPRLVFVLPLLAVPLVFSACAGPLVVGAAGAAGYFGLQDRPVKQTAEDIRIKLAIKDALVQRKFSYLTDVGIEVFYGDVLITGVVPAAADGEVVLDLARRTQGVKRVYNELFVGAAYSAGLKAKDAWISAQINTRLLANKNTYPLNYLLSVVGSMQTSEEQRHALHILRTTQGVKQVHDYSTIAGTPNAPNTLNQRGGPLPPAKAPGTGALTPLKKLGTELENRTGPIQAPNPIPDDR